MLTAVQLRFKLIEKTEHAGYEAPFRLVFDGSKCDPFGKYTPAARMDIQVTAHSAAFFEVGSEYELLVTKAADLLSE